MIIRFCEPIFNYICSIYSLENVNSEFAGYARVKSNIDKLLNQLQEQASSDTYELWRKYEIIKLPLYCFIDYMIISSKRDELSDAWNKKRLAFEEECYTGDETFFTLLKDALEEKGSFNDDILTFFYTCLSLGFKGVHEGDDDKISACMWEINKVLKLKPIERKNLFKELYSHVYDSSSYVKIRSNIIVPILATGLLVLVFCTLVGSMYYDAVRDAYKYINKVNYYREIQGRDKFESNDLFSLSPGTIDHQTPLHKTLLLHDNG